MTETVHRDQKKAQYLRRAGVRGEIWNMEGIY